MRLFLDTNVILDIFMRREPFYAASARSCICANQANTLEALRR